MGTLCAVAQSGYPAKLVRVQGQVKGIESGDCSSLMIQVSGADHSVLPVTASVNADCSFDSSGVPAGLYSVTVVALPGGASIYNGWVEVRGNSGPIELAVPAQTRHARPASGQVSIARLMHPPSKKAVKLFREADRLSQRGATAAAVQKLKEVLALAPQFGEAHGNLGAEYARLSRFDEALAEFDAARTAGLETSGLYTNLAYVLLAVARSDQAEIAAKRAIALEPSNTRAHYMMGYALLARHAEPAAILDHLSIASQDLPSAILLSAQLLANAGNFESAQVRLREYERRCPKAERARNAKWVNALPSRLSGQVSSFR